MEQISDTELRDMLFCVAEGCGTELEIAPQDDRLGKLMSESFKYDQIIYLLQENDTPEEHVIEHARCLLDPNRVTPEKEDKVPKGSPNKWELEKVGYWQYFFGHTPEQDDAQIHEIEKILIQLKVEKHRVDRAVKLQRDLIHTPGERQKVLVDKFWKLMTSEVPRADVLRKPVTMALYSCVHDVQPADAEGALAFGQILQFVANNTNAIAEQYPRCARLGEAQRGITRWEYYDMQSQTQLSPMTYYVLGLGVQAVYNLIESQLQLVQADVALSEKLPALNNLKELLCLPKGTGNTTIIKFICRGLTSTASELRFKNPQFQWPEGVEAISVPVVQILLHMLRRVVIDSCTLMHRIDDICASDTASLSNSAREDVRELGQLGLHGYRAAFRQLRRLATHRSWHVRQLAGVEMAILIEVYGTDAGDILADLSLDCHTEVANSTMEAFGGMLSNGLKKNGREAFMLLNKRMHAAADRNRLEKWEATCKNAGAKRR